MVLVFNDINASPAVDFDHGINGYAQKVDANNPVDFIKPCNKCVISVAGVVDLPRTTALKLWYAAGSPAALVALSGQILTAATADIGRATVLHLIISCALHCGLDIRLRSTDVLTIAKFDLLLGPNADPYLEFSCKVHAMLANDEEEMALLTVESQMCINACVASQIHRKTHSGHNWFSDESSVMGSTTGRICAIAGAQRVAFAEWMSNHGHDYAHLFSDESLTSLCDAVCGEEDALFPRGFIYGGNDVGTRSMADVFALGDALTDRYPAGIDGKASIIYGLDLLCGVIGDITSKLLVENSAVAEVAVKQLSSHMKDAVATRAAVTELKEILGDVAVFAYGYGMATPALEDLAGGSPALTSLAKGKVTAALKGSILAKRMKEVEADPKATQGLLAGFFKSLENVVARAAEAGVTVGLFVAPQEIVIPLTAAQKRALVEERRDAREEAVFVRDNLA